MVDSSPSLSDLGLTKIESHQFKRRSVRPDDELAQINYFRTHPEQREMIVTNPLAVDIEEQIKNLFRNESKWSVLRAAILAEPDGYYEQTFSKLPSAEQRQRLYDQIDISAEITIRIQKYIENNLSNLDQVSDDELYKILYRTAFGTENEHEIQTKYALSQRRGFRMSIVNFLEERNKLSDFRRESSQNPKAFAEKCLKNQFTGNISIDQLPIGFIIYLDEQDYALIESDDKSPKSIPTKGVTLSNDWLPDELQGKIILLNKGGKESGIKTEEELASTRRHEIRHILFREFHALQSKIYFSDAREAFLKCKTEQEYLNVSGRIYEDFVEKAKDEIIAYFSQGEFNESYEALRFNYYQGFIEEAAYALNQKTDLPEETKEAILESFTNDRKKCFNAIKRIRLVAERMYKQDDADQNDFAEALLRNTPGTKIHRLAKYTGLTTDEIRDGKIIKENDQKAIESLTNILDISEVYDERGQMALELLQQKTNELTVKSLPYLLKRISEALSQDDWGKEALQALQQITKQLPVESLPVLLDSATLWSNKSWTFPWVELVIANIKDFTEIHDITQSEKPKIIEALNKILEKQADKNFEPAAKFAQQIVNQIR